MRTRFAICTLVFFAGLSIGLAGEGTNQVVVTNRVPVVRTSPGPLNKMPGGTNAVEHARGVVHQIDTQIADLQREMHDVQGWRDPLEQKQKQRRDLKLPPDPSIDGKLSELDNDMTFLTNQLKEWRQERAVFLQTSGKTATGPRPTAPKGN